MVEEKWLATIIQTISEVLAQRGEVVPTIVPEDSVRDKVVLDSFEWAEVAIKLELALGQDPFELIRAQEADIQTVDDIAALYRQG
uniref:Carrier domain-containing protein n=1 Tax=Magnetococcus massalia (strain MO-1) TaxID=451514 RepID=A0A1S7LLN4_MAGMO|nr:protein of unknown function [Candidatus Magnetococcus massalia]